MSLHVPKIPVSIVRRNRLQRMQGVAVMADLLLDALRNTRTSPAEATDACKYLLQLQAEGSPGMEHCDPIQLYLTTQVGPDQAH